MEKTKLPLDNIFIQDAGSEGKCIARVDDMVIIIDGGIPGDVVDLRLTKNKKTYIEAKVERVITPSEKRDVPFCEHFGICGGCKWQDLQYQWQLHYKEKQVKDNLVRLGRIEIPELLPIIGSDKIKYYRNKLEYTFSDRMWLNNEQFKAVTDGNYEPGLGYHMPGRFDKVLDIKNCYLQPNPSNAIRLSVREYAVLHGMTFFNLRSQQGELRNLLIRNTVAGEWMVVVVFHDDVKDKREGLLRHLEHEFPMISSLLYVINQKRNDTIFDQEVCVFNGKDHITEEMEGLQFRISAKSFYQTNPTQAYELYKVTRDFADLKGDEVVYDFYTGTGTIANFVARKARKVIGVEYVPAAIEDAKINSQINGIHNTEFFAGDLKDIFTDEFISIHGKPDVIITDPPRAGMHEDVTKKIAEIGAEKVVYVSCNPATQARDLAILDPVYKVDKVQPVDMFPHTHHVENVVLLVKR